MGKIFDINKIWAYLTACAFSFFEPIGVTLVWMMIFILADMVTGIYASYVKGILITSHKMQRTVVKFLMYGGSIVLLQGFDVYMVSFASLNLAQIGATIICGIELYSVFEKCDKATRNVVFKLLTQFTCNKIKDQTGINIEENDKCK